MPRQRSPEAGSSRPGPQPRRRLIARPAGLAALVVLLATVSACGGSQQAATRAVWPGSAATHPGIGPSHLSVAKDTSALALNVLIADDGNNRLVSVSPRGQVVWQKRQADPGEAFVSRTGRTLLIAENARSVMLMRRVDNYRISYVYGLAGHPGAGEDRLSDPQTALETVTGEIVIADHDNCRVLLLTTSSVRPVKVLGAPGQCVHHVTSAPVSFAYPDAAFPTPDGGLVVTEQRPAWVDLLGPSDALLSATPLPTFSAPSDANETASGELIVTDATDPGKVVELDPTTGTSVWTYGPTSGPGELDRPAIARVLAGGDVLVADSGNDRVIVIDPKTDAIVWQYGHTHLAGTAPGYLHDPGSITLVPIGK